MGFRFQRRISILPGVSINLGKRGASVSVGPRGCKTTIGSRGIKHSYGIPGTGIRYETPYKKWGRKEGTVDNPSQQNSSLPPPKSYGPPKISLWTRICNMLGF